MADGNGITTMWQMATIPLGVEYSLNTIFASILLGGLNKYSNDKEKIELLNQKRVVARQCLKKFTSEFVFNTFYNNYAIFYEIIVTLNCPVFTEDQLESIINNNRDLILDSPYIDISKYSRTDSGNLASDDDIINAVTYNLKESLDALSNMYVSEDDFKSSCITYMDWYKNALAEYTALSMASIMTDTGLEVKLPNKRRRVYRGLKDMQEMYNANMRIIKSLSEDNRIKSYVLNSKWFDEQMQNENKTDDKSLFRTGLFKIDSVIGDLRRGNMIGIMGPPKGGKTRFSAYLVVLALLSGYNVCVWSLEGTTEEWEAMIISCFIAQVSYRKAQKSGKKDDFVNINSDDILFKRYIGSIESRKMIASAKQTLASGSNEGTEIGRLSFITGTAYVEDMHDELEAHYNNENQFDVLVIDQLIDVLSRKAMGKVERISEAYMRTKDFIANKLKLPALCIVPAQLKQETIDFLRRNPDETIDVTGGGESAETIRTPDTTIGLFSSKQERDSNMMKFYCVATRHSAAFNDFTAHCRLGSCLFYDGEE